MDELSLSSFKGASITEQTRTYIDALEAFDSAAQIQQLKEIERDRTANVSGGVLDIGCGFGLETLRIARRLGSDTSVTGLDISAEFLGEAKRRAAAAHLSAQFDQGDAQALPYPSQTYNYVRAERVLIYLQDPSEALREMQRVATPNAWLAVIEPDFSSTNVNHPNRDLARKALTFEVATAVVNNALPGLINAQMRDLSAFEMDSRVVVIPQALALTYFQSVGQRAKDAGAITNAELEEWSHGISALARSDKLFGTVGYFLFTARI